MVALYTGHSSPSEMMQPKLFWKWCLTSLLLTVVVVALFNLLMDPYLIFGTLRIPGINARKSAADSEFWLMKAYDVRRYAPKTILLGSSPTAVGIRAQSPVWKDTYRPVYNLATPWSGPYVNYRYLQHVMAMRHISLVVLGLEWDDFVAAYRNELFESYAIEQHLMVNRDGTPNSKELEGGIRAIGYASLSLQALQDSTAELIANLRGDSSDLIQGDFDWIGMHDSHGAGSYVSVVRNDVGIARMSRPLGSQPNSKVMAEVRAILDLCEAQGTSIIVFISPSYVDMLEMMDLVGYWKWYENWERSLVSLMSQYPTKRSGVSGAVFQLWDFSGYDSYSTESVVNDGQRLHWFGDFWHYRPELGDTIIEALMETGQNGFGVLLTTQNIEPHLAKFRELRQVYREHHPLETRRLRALHALVENSRTN